MGRYRAGAGLLTETRADADPGNTGEDENDSDGDKWGEGHNELESGFRVLVFGHRQRDQLPARVER